MEEVKIPSRGYKRCNDLSFVIEVETFDRQDEQTAVKLWNGSAKPFLEV